MTPSNAAASSSALATGYDFSSFFPVSAVSQAPNLVFSSGSTFFLTSVSNRVILRQTTTLTVAQSWLCGSVPTNLSHLSFSHDTAYVLAVSVKLGLCWVFGLGDGEEPLAVIKAGPEGITRAEFGVASHRREVLVWSDHGVCALFVKLTSAASDHPRFVIWRDKRDHKPQANGWATITLLHSKWIGSDHARDA